MSGYPALGPHSLHADPVSRTRGFRTALHLVRCENNLSRTMRLTAGKSHCDATLQWGRPDARCSLGRARNVVRRSRTASAYLDPLAKSLGVGTRSLAIDPDWGTRYGSGKRLPYDGNAKVGHEGPALLPCIHS